MSSSHSHVLYVGCPCIGFIAYQRPSAASPQKLGWFEHCIHAENNNACAHWQWIHGCTISGTRVCRPPGRIYAGGGMRSLPLLASPRRCGWAATSRAEVGHRLGSLAAASRLRSLCQVPWKRPSQRWRLFGSFSFIFPPTIHSSPYDVFDDFSAPAPPYCTLSNHTRYFALQSHVLPLCRRCPCRCSLHRQCVLFASPPHLRRILQD